MGERGRMAFGTGREGQVARWLAVAVVLGLARPAAAHLLVTSPQSRHDSLKRGPCGAGADDPRGSVVHTFAPGATITVAWDEFVDHPGHFRISFDDDGQDDFVDPASFTDVSGGPTVLIDDIPDRDGGGYTQTVTLPDVECDNCTLQVIQVMTDKAPYGDGNDLYYQCVDLVLSRSASEGSTTAETREEEGCGCRSGGGPAVGLVGAVGLLGLGRRRVSRGRPRGSR